MEKLPAINFTLTEEAEVSVSEDNISALIVSGVAVAGQFALNDVIGPFFSTADAEAKGINAAYDTTNTCHAYKQIKDFFDELEIEGATGKLYVQVVAKTVTFAQMIDKDLAYAPKVMDTDSTISMIAIARTPASGYTPTYEDQFDADIWAAVAEAKLFQTDQFTQGRTVSTILIEGRDFQGTVSSAKDMSDVTETDAEFVHVIIGNDYAHSAANAHAAKYASVGLCLGTAAANMVQRNIGRVQNGSRQNVVKAGLSNGQPLISAANQPVFTDTQLNTLNGFRYIFFRRIPGKSGYYWNGDHCACSPDKKFNGINRCRPMMKVVRIVNATYTESLLDDPELDPDSGKLNAAVIKDFQSSVEREVTERMLTGVKQISGFRALADPDQNVQSTERIKIKTNVVHKGMNKGFDVEISYVTSLNG